MTLKPPSTSTSGLPGIADTIGDVLAVPEFTGVSATDTAATQAVLTAAITGDEVLLPDGDLTLNAGLVCSKGIKLTSKGNTRILYSSLAGMHAIECYGSLNANTNLTSNAVANTSQSVTGVAATNLFTAAAHGLVVGQTVSFLVLTGGAGLATSTTYYVISSGFTANDFKVSTTAAGTELDFTTNLTAGTLVPDPSLSFATSGYAVGDHLMLRSTADWSAFEPTAKQGEVVVIKSINTSAVVTLETPLFDTYTTANTATVAKINYIEDFEVNNRITFVNTTPEQGNGQGIWLRYCKSPKLVVRSELACGSAFFLETCIEGSFDIEAYDGNTNAAAAHGYGATIAGASQRCDVKIVGRRGWTLITTNGTTRGGVPRDCHIIGTGYGPYVACAFHSHYVTENFHYTITTTGCVGAAIYGKNDTITARRIDNSPTDGIYIDTTATGSVIDNPFVIGTKGGAGVYSAIRNLGTNTRIMGGLLDGIGVGGESIYNQGPGAVIKGTTMIPGTGKTGLTTFDSTDTWVADDLTIINANFGISYGLPAPLVTPTPRISNLKTYSVTTPVTPAVLGNGGLISRSAATIAAMTVPSIAAGIVTGSEAAVYQKSLQVDGAGAGWELIIGADCSWFRNAANVMGTNDDLAIATAGKGLQVKEGANAKMGTATLVAGTVTVSTTAVTANSRINYSVNVAGGAQGFLRVSARTAGTSFVITSTSGTETSTIVWMLVEPA